MVALVSVGFPQNRFGKGMKTNTKEIAATAYTKIQTRGESVRLEKINAR